MNAEHPSFPRAGRRRFALACLVLFVLGALTPAAASPGAVQPPRAVVVAAATPLWGSSLWEKTWSVLNRALGERSRLIRCATIFLILGIFFLMKR
jgi:hypothetical protein